MILRIKKTQNHMANKTMSLAIGVVITAGVAYAIGDSFNFTGATLAMIVLFPTVIVAGGMMKLIDF